MTSNEKLKKVKWTSLVSPGKKLALWILNRTLIGRINQIIVTIRLAKKAILHKSDIITQVLNFKRKEKAPINSHCCQASSRFDELRTRAPFLRTIEGQLMILRSKSCHRSSSNNSNNSSKQLSSTKRLRRWI